MQHFRELGIPSQKNEKYKYSRIEPLFAHEYQKHFAPKRIAFNVDDIFRCDIPELDTHLALVLNGFYLPKGEKLTTLPNGVILGSLAEAAIKFPNLVNGRYNSLAENKTDGLIALNTAFAQDGVFIYIPGMWWRASPFRLSTCSCPM